MNMIPAAKRPGLNYAALSLLLPQNGGADGAVSVLSRNGPGPQLARPTALVVKNEHIATKNLRGEDYEGSFPCTPDDSEVEMSYTSAGKDEALDEDTRQLLRDFFQLITGSAQPRWNQKPALTTMKRVVENLLEKHRYAYNGMINKLSVDDRGEDVTFITSVAQSMFDDGQTNWGRIASLLSFGAVVCQYLKTKGRESCVDKVGEEISTYLLSYQRDWLVRNNSWDGFVDFFRVEDPESKVRSTLMAVAGIAGIGATLAMLIRANTGPRLVTSLRLVTLLLPVHCEESCGEVPRAPRLRQHGTGACTTLYARLHWAHRASGGQRAGFEEARSRLVTHALFTPCIMLFTTSCQWWSKDFISIRDQTCRYYGSNQILIQYK